MENKEKKEEKETQLSSQSVDKNFVDPATSAGLMSWFGTLILRSFVTFFAMEFIRSWWGKFINLYGSKEGENEATDESVSKQAKEPKG